jgi:hypothetical protein
MSGWWLLLSSKKGKKIMIAFFDMLGMLLFFSALIGSLLWSIVSIIGGLQNG